MTEGGGLLTNGLIFEILNELKEAQLLQFPTKRTFSDKKILLLKPSSMRLKPLKRSLRFQSFTSQIAIHTMAQSTR